MKEFMESLMKEEIQAFLEENGESRNGYYERDLLTKYVRHNDNKFKYDDKGIAHRKHIIAYRIRYIGKESNNLDESQIMEIDENS